MTGAEYVAEFLARQTSRDVFTLNGGACAHLVDAVARHPDMRYFCFQHEQAAAMAADASWRVDGSIGVAVATSGPGATNLLTGIACSYFDSIPSFHITGQVNRRERAAYGTATPRQTGFQETKIVEMARPIVKYAAQVTGAESLRRELATAVNAATTGRKGPVLIDLPIDIQQMDVGDGIDMLPRPPTKPATIFHNLRDVARQIDLFFARGQRPIVLFGAGVGLAGAGAALTAWLARHDVPFVASWNGLTYFDHGTSCYLGQIGVYGNRGANFVLQNADRVLVLGSRLDNRQRSGNPKNFACGAKVHVIDIDAEELRKYEGDCYGTSLLDLAFLPQLLELIALPAKSNAWVDYVEEMRSRYFRRDVDTFAAREGTMSPYAAVRRINELIDQDAVVAADTGAAMCWIYQTFHRTRQTLMTAGGHSPMGYALPASIAAAIRAPRRQTICCIGDGGFQLNLQELQTIRAYGLNVKIVIFDNHGYGIIKQFQDSYLQGRHEASGRGYGVPHLERIAAAYDLRYFGVDRIEDLNEALFKSDRACLVHLHLHPNTLIEPKLEMGRPINDQFPYISDLAYAAGNRFVDYPRVLR